MKHSSCQIPFLLILASLPGFINAQTTLVNWDQSWNFFHPTAGTLPPGSGLTIPHPEGSTPWFASESDFNATYSGPSFTASGLGFESGSGQGPLGYGSIKYTTDTVDPEFQAIATILSTPTSGDRLTAYFRTTFTVPDNGSFYVTPSIRYLLDDGGFIYLDGELILEVNVAQGALDNFGTQASGTGNTETVIRTAELSLPVGARTGGNLEVNPAVGANATLMSSINRLAPGEHTLAVSAHNNNSTSSDLALAVQFVSVVADCLITGSAATSTRNHNNTPKDPDDDTISVDLTIVPEGVSAATWLIAGPAGSSLVGTTGAYHTPVTLQNIPISEFTSGSLIVEIADSANAGCSTTIEILPQRIIGLDSINDSPLVTTGDLAASGWIFDELARTITLSNPEGSASLYSITSSEINLTEQPDIRFTGTLTVIDSSTGTEVADQFNAFLILDGDTNNPVSLIDRHDIITRDGLLTDAELAPGKGTFARTLDTFIPASANSARFVIEAINNSKNENFVVSGLGFSTAAPALEAYALPPVYDNNSTDDPSDDIFTSDFVITSANLGASTGWTSNETPTSGLYTDANPVTFGPFRPFRTPITVTVTDDLDPTKAVSIPLTLADPTLTISAPTNITRVENGPGFDDDTFTFDLEILGTNGGPGWKINSNAISPNSGDFGITTLTLAAPLVQGTFAFEIVDRSYRNVSQPATIKVPGRYLIGQSDLSGNLENIATSLVITPSAAWVNDVANRTLTLINNSSTIQDVVSETIDLSTQDTVYFSAVMRASEASLTSNFETSDRFRAELYYRIDDTIFIVNLVAPYDTGDGGSATTGTTNGTNGPADGFINGYSGTSGADLQTDAVYASNAEDYDANRTRDEFNRNGANAAATFSATFPLTAEIPAAAEEAFIVISGQGVGGNEDFVVSDLLFSTKPFSLDDDDDGIPTKYEIANGLNPNDPSDRNTDLDKDGQSNYAEFLAGTAANDANSNLRITSYTIDGKTVSTFWTSVPGKTYRIEFSTNLITWNDLGFDFSAANAPMTVTGSGDFDLNGVGTPTEAYFRVVVAE
jgi:hypothetical protein